MSPRLAEGAGALGGVRRTARRTVQLTGRVLRMLWRLRPGHRRAAPVPTLGDRREPPLVVKL